MKQSHLTSLQSRSVNIDSSLIAELVRMKRALVELDQVRDEVALQLPDQHFDRSPLLLVAHRTSFFVNDWTAVSVLVSILRVVQLLVYASLHVPTRLLVHSPFFIQDLDFITAPH